MKIIGVQWDHPSGAAALVDGKVVAAVSEERFTRKKNDMVFPQAAIRHCEKGGKADLVAVASLEASYKGQLYHYSNLSVKEMVREQHEVWKPRLYEGRDVDDALVFKDIWKHDQYPESYWEGYHPERQKTFSKDRLKIVSDYMGVPLEKVAPMEHHLCHACYGYYGSPYRGEKATVITIDGAGDGLNATVSVVEGGRLRRIYETNKCVLGRIYSHVTLALGMKRLEHEFKVMGLAPYGKERYAKQAYEVFDEVLDLQGIEFVWKSKPKDSYFHFKDRLEGIRFDNVAAGMQMWVEDVLCRWVANVVKETGVGTVVLSGGVSMNIKAMGAIGRLPCVERLFICGSGSDDSMCIGAAMAAALEAGVGPEKLGMDGLLLGPEVGTEDAEGVLSKDAPDAGFCVERGASPERIAGLLEDGLVLGRCIGRMEFGQRALGNRSILADPTVPDVVPRINAMIKNRDFWMPFAPVVLDSFAPRYLENPKGMLSPHMTLSFESTPEGFKAMKAACHAADASARAQILERKDNPELYKLLEAFAKRTGRGALLNTSFNLHGYPIVNTAKEAFEVLLASDLDGLIVPGGLILRRKRPPQAPESR